MSQELDGSSVLELENEYRAGRQVIRWRVITSQSFLRL
jgi:hypothetical protein